MTTPPPPSPSAPRGRSYHVMPILITLFGGILLAFGSCVAFLSVMSTSSGASSNLSMLYAAGFCVGIISANVGIVWAIGAFIMFLIRLASDEP